MNAYMNISVRVLSAQAQGQIKALQAQVASLQKQLAAANATSAGGILGGGAQSARSRKSLASWGSQVQWAGRQVRYNFTVPLLLAGGAAMKFALDNERAMTRVNKVYGDQAAALEWAKKNTDQWAEGATSAAEHVRIAFENETKALGEAFEALSSHYGVQQKEVIEVAGAWAAAGASGRALAESTELSLQAATLGEMDLAKATESLIAIQAQYSLSTKGLNLTLAELNAIENQTGISMQGLIDGFARSAGVAREAGIDVRHLGAMLAALVPATGTAATAGNALKTIISRLMAPTGDAADVMREFGVRTKDAAWQSSTAMERLMILAGHMNNTLHKTGKQTADTADDMYRLSDSQKQVVATVLGSRYQMNRFLVLMRELGPAQSYFEKALDATSDRQAVFAQKTRELNAVLDSSPKKLEILWYTLQNGMADAIQPMIPYLLYTVSLISRMVTAFSNLDPHLQKFIFILALAVAAVGLFMPLIGTTAVLLSYVGRAFVGAAAMALGFFTSQVKVGVGSVAVTTSLWGMAAALIALPFRAAAAGLGFFLGMALKIPLVTKMLAVAAAGFRLIGAIILASVNFSAMVRILAGVAASVYMIAAHLVAVWGGAMVAMVSRWMFAWTAMISSGGMFKLVQGVSLAFSAMSTAVGFWLNVMLGKIIAFDVAATGAFYAFRSRMIALWVAFQGAMLSIWSAFTLIAGGFWSGLYIAITQLSAAFGRAMVAIHAAMHKVLLGIQAAWGAASAALMRAWAVVSAGITAVWGRVQILLIRAYYAAQLVLQKAWGLVRIALDKALYAVLYSLTLAYYSVQIAAQKAWAAIAFNLHLAWTILIMTLQMKFISAMKKSMAVLAAVMTGPWGMAIIAVVALLIVFRKQIATIWGNIIEYFGDSTNAVVTGVLKAWNALPAGITNALIAVVNVVREAAMAVYEWFSYLNPFARHSPSLVENVTKGMDEVVNQFGKLKGVGGHVRGAYADIKSFNRAAAGLVNTVAGMEAAEDRKIIAKIAPGVLDEYNKLSARLKQLEGDLARIEPRLNAQQRVVDRWSAALDTANYRLDQQQYILDGLTRRQQKYQDLVDEAASRIDHFSNMGITGQQAMSDAIFENEMAQKRLRLEMMRLEDANGTLDEMRSKIEAINGAQEVLRGTQENLRQKGAGSDVLGGYQDQIDALEKQKEAYKEAAAPLQSMTDQLEALQRKGEELDLVNSLQFDPLRRKIEQAANAMEEMPFDQIMQGVRGARRDMEKYQEKLDQASAAVDKQQKVVDKLTLARDKLQHRLDQEQRKLDLIQNAYDAVNDAISDVKSTMDLATQAAEKMGEKLDKAAKKAKKAGYVSPAVQNFRDAAGGNFASVGGDGIPMRKNWSDQSDKIKEFTNDLAKQTAGVFDDLNPFTWIKSKWSAFKNWWSGVWAEISAIGRDFFGSIFSGVGGGGGIDFSGIMTGIAKFFNTFRGMWATTMDFLRSVGEALGKLWDLFGPDLIDTVEAIGDALVDSWGKIGPELSGLWKEIKEFGPALEGLFNIAKVMVPIALMPLLLVLKVLANIISKVIGPVIEWLGDIIAAIIRVFRGAFQFISGFLALFSGDFETAFEKMGAGIANIFGGIWDAIWSTLKNGFKVILGTVWGFIEGIWEFFVWLWDELVGHSIIPDLIEGIKWWFEKLVDVVKWVWDKFAKPIFEGFKWVFGKVIAAVKLWIGGIKIAWAVLKTLAVWFWDNVLKPIWDKVMELWPLVRTGFAAWWAGIKLAWGVLLNAAGWIWENVLRPVWKRFREVWTKFIWPALKAWWAGIKRAWNALKRAGEWMWDNVLSPVWRKVKELWNRVRPEIAKWWDRIKTAWNNLKTAAVWIWQNVLKPIWDKIKKLWEDVKAELTKWRDRIERAWDALKRLGNWIKLNVMDPVFDAITGGWKRVKTWLEENKDMLLGPAKGIMSGVRTVINTLINGLNKISDILPGDINWNIPVIPEMASGGLPMSRRVGSGFKTNGARAIVGEGKANHPEFVIPTDPTYRRRAVALLHMAAGKLGVNKSPGGDSGDLKRLAQSPTTFSEYGGIPQFGIGGWIEDRWDDVEDMGQKLKDQIEKLGKYAVGKVMNPILDSAKNKIHDWSWDVPKVPALHVVNKVQDWTRSTDEDLNKFVTEAKESNTGGRRGRAAMRYARSMMGTPYQLGGFGPGGIDCSAFMSAIANVYRGDPPYSRKGTTATFPWAGYGFKPGVAPGLKGFTIGSVYPYPGSRVGHMAGNLFGTNVESSSGYGVRVGEGSGINQSAFNEFYHLGVGGIAKARRGGVFANLAEAGHDEAVIPLPHGWQNSPLLKGTDKRSGETHLHFHGATLEFPNITSGDDAQDFIDNLKKLAED